MVDACTFWYNVYSVSVDKKKKFTCLHFVITEKKATDLSHFHFLLS